MRRWLSAALFFLSAMAVWADTAPPFAYYIHDTTGKSADTVLPSIYQFPATPRGSNSHIVVKGVNITGALVTLDQAVVTVSATSTVANTNFTTTGVAQGFDIPAGGSFIFTINFSPLTTGVMTGFLLTSYHVDNDGGLFSAATLTATATDPALVLGYQASDGSTVTLQPSAPPGLNFGNISTSSSYTVTFTLSNFSTVAIPAPSISIPPPTVYSVSPFAVNLTSLPASLDAGTSANFTVTFAPGQIGLDTASLIVGANTYPILGEGVVIADIDALQILYTDSTGVNVRPQAASPISFGQLTAGGSGNNVLTFTVTNPTTSFNPVTLAALTVTGAAFTLGNVAGISTFPASLSPGASFSFTISFTGGPSGNYAGSLTIGTRTFSLSGLSISSPLPAFSLAVNPSPLTSQQQASVTVQFAAVSPLNLTGTITLAFSPSITGVTDDPAILFLATSSRQLPISVAAGSQTATYNGQSAIKFQTGTTAGSITFTVSFPNTTDFTQTYTITPGIVQISSASAVRSNPNLVVTLSGYDNSYSAGRLNFTFYDTSGNVLSPVAADASGSFQQLFFTNNTAGGAFSLQATFPVTGDVTKVGSVAITVNNSVGQANSTQVF